MTLKLNLDHILKPFTESVKSTILLPNHIELSSIEQALGDFFESSSLKVKAHEVHTHNHLPPHLPTFYIKAEPLPGGFYLVLTPPAYAKVLEKFYGSKNTFTDDRLSKGAVGFLLTSLIGLINDKKVFPSLSFFMSEFEQTSQTLQSVKIEIELEDSFPLVCELYFPESFVESYLSHFAQNLQDQIHNVSFTSSLIVGHVKLSKEAFFSCKVHDAILLDEILYMPLEQKGLAKLQYQNNFFAQVRLNHNTIKFLDFNPLPDEVTMEQQSDNPLKSLSDVSLEFHVEFARLNLNFSEFEKLTSGQTLELFKDNPTSCYLTLQGQRVAKGELVKVGEQMAFLIEELKS